MKKFLTVLLVCTLVLGIFVTLEVATSGIVYANQIQNIANEVTSKTTTSMFSDLEKTIKTFLGEGFVLTRLVIIGILVIFAVITFGRYSAAEDQPQLKSSLKKKLVAIAIAIIGIANITRIFEILGGVKF